MATSGEPLEKKILDWLSEHGYPFEMRIASSLTASDFRVTQSHYYTDFESGQPREIDVIGRLYSFVEPENYIAIAELETFVAVECKSSANPWVVFCETKSSAWDMQQVVCNGAGSELLRRNRSSISKTELYRYASKAGHGVAQVLGGNADVPYAAIMSALKAAEAHARDARMAEVRMADGGRYSDICECSQIIPAVAITAPLFECNLAEGGVPILREVDHSAVAFRYPNGSGESKKATMVNIVTERGWSKFQGAIISFHAASQVQLRSMIPACRDAD